MEYDIRLMQVEDHAGDWEEATPPPEA